MMGSSYCNGIEAILLATLGLGYVICYLASKTEKTLRLTGYVIGTFMMVLSGVLLILSLLVAPQACRAGMMPQHKMMMRKMMMQGGQQQKPNMQIPAQSQSQQ